MKRPAFAIPLSGLLAVLGWVVGAHAGAPALPLEVHGFLQGHAAARVGGADCPAQTECDRPFNEQRLQLKTDGGGLNGRLGYAARLDLVHDAALDESELDAREVYADYNAEDFTLRAGRQVITWGVSDLLFINDTFPKDWVSFFGGLPLEYLKRGSDAVRVDLFPEFADVQLVLARFREDRLPDRERFLLPGPNIASSPERPSSPELGLRVSRYIGNWDGAFYFSSIHFRTPSPSRNGGQWRGRFPRLDTYGVSLSGSRWNGVLNLEVGYHDSTEDRDGTDPSVENSQTRLLVGYSRQIAEDTTVGVQGYVEWMHDYDDYLRTLPAGHPQRDEVRTVATLRLTRFQLHQTLRLSLFAFWGVSDGDGYVIPSVRYAFSDNFRGELGANLFVGDRDGRFGVFGDNDNIYLTLRYTF